ncbi:MATE family efflux transporter [Enterocloster aldenensis]|uniref:MATE family efflux transporter n=1 Tax=Enterocloster aldenensis TaxID=358742 RepID=UPI00402A37FE
MPKPGRAHRADLTEGRPGISLLLFALPMILGNLFQQLYNMADSMIVGNFVGEDALAAVGASYALTNVFIMVAIGGGNGVSVLISQYLGARQYGRMKTSVSTSLITFLCISLMLGWAGFGFNGLILDVLHTPDNILEQARLYLGIYFLGLPFLFMYNILAAVFNAMGDSRTPLGFLVFSSMLNVALDLTSVTFLGMGVDGVAIATVFSQGISALLLFCILIKRLKGYGTQEKEGFKFYDMKMLGKGTRISVPSILQQSIVSVGRLLVQSVVNGFGSAALAGYSAGGRIESICIVPMSATGNAMATFTAQNMGAKRMDRVRQGYRASYMIVAFFALLIALALGLFKGPLIGAFLGGTAGAAGGALGTASGMVSGAASGAATCSASATAFETGTGYLSGVCYFFLFVGLKACADGVLRGAGDMLVFTAANLVNLGIRVFAAFYFAPVWGVAAVWYSAPMGWIANYIISFLRYLTGKWREKRVI